MPYKSLKASIARVISGVDDIRARVIDLSPDRFSMTEAGPFMVELEIEFADRASLTATVPHEVAPTLSAALVELKRRIDALVALGTLVDDM